jgi:hypothetical protein
MQEFNLQLMDYFFVYSENLDLRFLSSPKRKRQNFE